MCSPVRLPALSVASDAVSMPSLSAGDVRVEALDLLGHVLLQLPANGDARQVRALVDLPFPSEPNRAAGGAPCVMWLGPRAWIAITPSAEDAASLAVRAGGALRAAGGHAVDLTDAHQSVRVSGREAASLISQGCPLDLGDEAFPVGAATRTLVARTPAILHRERPDAYLVHVDRSLASQFWSWLQRGVDEIAALSHLEQEARR